MVSSMTAFARVEREAEVGGVSWELRSVNHRYLEIGLRLPEELRAIEGPVREKLNQRLGRGKVDVALRFKAPQLAGGELALNKEYLLQLTQVMQEIQAVFPTSATVNVADIMRWPGVLQPKEIDQEKLQAFALETLEAALDELIAARQREGEKLKAVILQRCAIMTELAQRAKERLPTVLTLFRSKLQDRVSELSQTIDPQRLEQEVVLMAQKMDVAEELDRLTAHVSELQHIFTHTQAIGRRLDFLMQEFNREANTLGSKSIDVETTRISVEMKVLIEQMREQIQNIE